MRRKSRQPDREYLAFIASLRCAVCALIRAPQTTRTEVAHVGERGLGQKCSDRETAPLCCYHHRIGKYAHHKLGKKFWEHWKLDKAILIEELNNAFERAQKRRIA